MVHGLDIVAVRIEQKSRIVAGMVRPLARRAVVAAAIGEPGLIKRIDRRPILSLEREVVAAGELSAGRLAVGAGDKQLVRPEERLTGAPDRSNAWSLLRRKRARA